MNKRFEDFLEQEKRSFCQFRCSLSREECDICPLDDFISEIRDSNDIRIRRKKKKSKSKGVV